MEALKPCPFCGGEIELDFNHPGYGNEPVLPFTSQIGEDR